MTNISSVVFREFEVSFRYVSFGRMVYTLLFFLSCDGVWPTFRKRAYQLGKAR